MQHAEKDTGPRRCTSKQAPEHLVLHLSKRVCGLLYLLTSLGFGNRNSQDAKRLAGNEATVFEELTLVEDETKMIKWRCACYHVRKSLR